MAATAALPAAGNQTPILSPSQSPPVVHGAIGALPAHLSPPPQIKAGAAGQANAGRPVSASANRTPKPGTTGTGSRPASAAGSRPGTPAKELTCTETVHAKADACEKECCCCCGEVAAGLLRFSWDVVDLVPLCCGGKLGLVDTLLLGLCSCCVCIGGGCCEEGREISSGLGQSALHHGVISCWGFTSSCGKIASLANQVLLKIPTRIAESCCMSCVKSIKDCQKKLYQDIQRRFFNDPKKADLHLSTSEKIYRKVRDCCYTKCLRKMVGMAALRNHIIASKHVRGPSIGATPTAIQTFVTTEKPVAPDPSKDREHTPHPKKVLATHYHS